MKRTLSLKQVEFRVGRWVTLGDQITIAGRRMKVTLIDAERDVIVLED